MWRGRPHRKAIDEARLHRPVVPQRIDLLDEATTEQVHGAFRKLDEVLPALTLKCSAHGGPGIHALRLAKKSKSDRDGRWRCHVESRTVSLLPRLTHLMMITAIRPAHVSQLDDELGTAGAAFAK